MALASNIHRDCMNLTVKQNKSVGRMPKMREATTILFRLLTAGHCEHIDGTKPHRAGLRPLKCGRTPHIGVVSVDPFLVKTIYETDCFIFDDQLGCIGCPEHLHEPARRRPLPDSAGSGPYPTAHFC